MGQYNKVILIGNLTRDPELRYATNGTAICNLSIAVNREWKAEGGEQKKEVTFVPISAFGRQAETITQYLKKGNPLMVEGRLRENSWTDKTSQQKRTQMTVVLEGFQFIGSNERESEPNQRGDAPRETSPAPAPRVPAPTSQSDEDDVPF